jgi:hypothetical protein
MNSFEAFNLPTATFDDARIMTIVNTFAERLTGQSDPAQGRETRQGGHPSPAKTTLALLDQSSLMQGTTKELIRSQISRMGEAIASMYQQFETNEDGKLQRVLGQADAERVEGFLFPTDPVSGTLMFDVSSMSGQNTPDEEMKRAVLVSQMNQNYWLMTIQGLQVLSDPNVSPLVREGIIGGIRAQTKSQLRFLEGADIDDLERYVLKLAENDKSGEDDLRTAVERAREIAANSVAPGQPGVGGNGAVAPNGAAGPPGIPGGFG